MSLSLNRDSLKFFFPDQRLCQIRGSGVTGAGRTLPALSNPVSVHRKAGRTEEGQSRSGVGPDLRRKFAERKRSRFAAGRRR